jgi:hypothetical protein
MPSDPHTSTSKPPKHARRLVFLYAFVAWIAFVAVRIEVLNAAAGDLLPRFNESLKQNRAHGGSGKWRARWMTEASWRGLFIRTDTGEADSRPLTPEERARMVAEVERANAYARLHDFIAYFGWALQYVAVGVACLCGSAWAFECRRQPRLTVAYLLPVLAAAAAGALAVHRGYFTSMVQGV